MNKIYKLIWSQTANAFVVVSELASARGKSSSTTNNAALGAWVAVSEITKSKGKKSNKAIKSGVLVSSLVLFAGNAIAASYDAGGGSATGQDSVAIGSGAASQGLGSVAMGANSQAIGINSTAIGPGAKTAADDALAIGRMAQAIGRYSTAVGDQAKANKEFSNAFGYRATANAVRSTAIGMNSSTSGDDSVSIGNSSSVSGNWSAALGQEASVQSDWSTAIGFKANAKGTGSTAIGTWAKTSGVDAAAFGNAAEASGSGSLALGRSAKTDSMADQALAVGFNASAAGIASNAIGANAKTTARNATAIGSGAKAYSHSGIAMGTNAEAGSVGSEDTLVQAMALGANSKAKAQSKDVALGEGSETSTVANTPNTQIDGKTYTYAGTNAKSTLSVGKSGAERTITNVAAGRISGTSTDAINGSQLYGTNQAINSLAGDVDTLGNTTAAAIGGNSTYNPSNHTVSVPTYNINNQNVSTVSGAINKLNEGWNLTSNGNSTAAVRTNDTVDIGTATGETNLIVAKNGNTIDYSLNKNLDLGATGSVNAGGTVINNNGLSFVDSNGATLANTPSIKKDGINAGGQQIANVKAGTGDTDAVNVSQLKAATTHYYSVNDGGTQGSNYNNDGATGGNSLAAGVGTQASGISSTAIGHNAKASSANAIAMGVNASASQRNALAMGSSASSATEDSVAIGKDVKVLDTGAPQTDQEGSVAIGSRTEVSGKGSVGIGRNVRATARNAVAIGDAALATNTQAVAIARDAQASGAGAVAMGSASRSTSSHTTALGVMANASVSRSVALGSEAVADRIGFNIAMSPVTTDANATFAANQVYANAGATQAAKNAVIATVRNTTTDTYGAVSVGNAGVTRQIINLAPGSEDSDAVNVAQLKAATTHYYSVNDNGVQRANYNNDGATGINSLAAGTAASATESAATAVGNQATAAARNSVALGNQATANTAWSVAIGNKADATGSSAVAIGNGATTTVGDSVALGAGSKADANGRAVTEATVNGLTFGDFAGSVTHPGKVVSVGAKGEERQIKNVAPGQISNTSTDAINGSQLYATNAKLGNVAKTVVENFGGNATLNPDGSITYTNIGNTGKDNIHDAIQAATTKVEEADGIKVVPTTNADGSTTYTVSAKTDGTTTKIDGNGNIAAVTTTFTPSTDGKVGAPVGNGDSLVTANTVADAINNSGWKATSGATGSGVVDGTTEELINPSETVTFQAGDNMVLNQAGNVFTYSLNKDININSVQFNDGPKITNDGDNIKVGDKDGNATKITNVKAGEADTDAVNVSQLKEAADNLVTTGFNIADGKGGNDNVKLGETVTFADPAGNIITTVTDNKVEFGLNSTLSVGKDGEPGKVGIKGADGKDAISLNGEDGTIGINGKDGANATLTVEKGKPGLDGKDGQTRIVYTKPDGSKEEVATLNDGLNFKADDGSIVPKKLNETLEIVGGADKDSLTDNNIGVNNKDGKLTVQLAKDININSVQFNDGPKITNDGNNIKVGDKDGNATKITNVKAGEADTDAVNVSQLKEAADNLVTTGFNIADGKGGNDNVKLGETVTFADPAGNIITTVTDNKVEFGLNSTLSVGKDGEPGKVGIKGADGKDAISLNGEDGTIGINGKDGTNATLTVEKGKPGLDGKDGQTRIVYTKPDGSKEEVATLNDGLNFKADDGSIVPKKLNETLEIVGGADKDSLTDNNIGVNNKDGKLTVQLAKDLKGIDSITVNNGPVISGNGIDMNGDKITNLAPGVDATDAVNVSQLEKAQAAATTKVEGDKGVSVTPTTNADGSKTYTVAAKTDNTTVKVDDNGNIAAVTTTFTPSTDGKVGAPVGNGDSLVTAKTVADAINNSGWKLAADGTTGTELINPSDTVTFKTGSSNLTVKRDGANITYDLAKDIAVDSVKTGDTTVNTYGVSIANADPNKVVSLTASGLNNGNNRITNVAAGQAGTDAVNVSQLKAAQAAATTKVEGDKGVSVTPTTNADGSTTYTVAAKTDNTTVKVDNNGNIAAVTTTFTPSTDGKVGAPVGNGDSLVTANTVADAINNSGWKATSGATGSGVVDGTTEELINPSETVTFQAGDNMVLNQAGNVFAYSLNKDININSVQFNDGPKITNDGDNIKVGDKDGNATKITNVKAGEADTDAVNVSQLKEAADNLVTTGFNIADGKGGNDNVKLGETVTFADPAGNIITTVTDNKVEFGLNSTLSVGKDGEPGKVGIKGADGKDAISLNGEDGTIGINGKDGANATLTVEKGKPGLDGKDGQTRIVYTKPDGSKEEVATLNDGLNFKADDGSIVPKKLNETLEIVGGADKDSLTDNNIGVNNKDGKLTVQLAKDININSVQFNDGPKITNDGNNIKVGDKDGNATKITNVKAGEADTDAVNVSQLKEAADNLVTTGFNIADGKGGNDNVKLGETVTFADPAGNIITTVTDNKVEFGLNSTLSVGKDGEPGKVGIKGADGKDAISLNGEDGTIGINGKDGTNATLTVEKGKPGLDGKDGQTRIVYTKPDGSKEEVATLNDGLNFKADDGSIVPKKLNETLEIVGGADKDSLTDNNIGVNNKDGKLTVQLAKDLKGIDSITVNNGPVISGNGIDMNGDKITNLAPGVDATDAVNVSQLEKAQAAATTKVEGDKGVSVTPTTNADGSKTYTVAAKTDNTTVKVDDNGNIAAVTTTFTPSTDGKVGAPVGNGDSLVTAKTVADAINNSGWKLAADGTTGTELINPSDTVTFKTGSSNLTVKRDGANITYDLAKDIAVDSVKTGDTTVNTYGVSIANADPNKVVSLTASGLNNGNNRITNVAAGQAGTDAVNVSQLKAAQAAATTKVEGDKGVSVTPTTNADGSTTYTVAAKTDNTTVKVDNNGNIAAVTTTFTPSTDGKVGAPVGNGDSLVTAKTVADAINNSGWKLAADGTTGTELINPSDTVTFKTGSSNLTVKRDGANITYDLARNINVDSVQIGANGPKITNDGNNIKVGDKDGNATKITNVAPGVDATDAVNVSQLKAVEATANKGWNLTTNGKADSKSNVKPGDTVDFNNTDRNVKIENTGNKVTVNLNKDIDLTKDGSVTIGDTKVNNDGLTIVGGPSVTKSGINAGGNKITNVADGVISATSKDAINGSQLYNVQKAAVAAKTEVKAGDNVQIEKATGTNGQDIYTVSAKDTSASVTAGSTAVAVTKGATTKVGTTDVTDYKVDLSQSAKDDIKKGVDAKDIVDNKGLTFAGDNNSSTEVQKLGSTVNVNGDSNITTQASGNTVKVTLNPNVTVESVTATKSVNVGSGGAQVALTTNVGKDGVRELSVGSANAPTRITNVAPGVNGTDAVNVDQLKGVGQHINNRIDDVADDANAGVSSAMAMAALPQAYIPGKSMLTGGIASYNGEGAVAVGFSKLSDNGRWVLKVSGSADTQGNAGGAVGAGFHF